MIFLVWMAIVAAPAPRYRWRRTHCGCRNSAPTRGRILDARS